MIISEKQLMLLMNCARYVCMDKNVPEEIRKKTIDLVSTIEAQQSEELKVINE